MGARSPRDQLTTTRKATGVRRARQNAPPCLLPPLQLRTKAWLEHAGRFIIGEGGLQLLLEVEARGSLLAAARQIGWSYRHAWEYLRRAEQVIGTPLVQPRPGKGRRRGTVLTPIGRCLLARLREARERLNRAVGVTGPTRQEIAARGRRRTRGGRSRRDARDR